MGRFTLSKLAFSLCVLDDSLALEKKKSRAGKFLTFLGAGMAGALSEEQQLLQVKWHNSQDELGELLSHHSKMQGRFERFMQEKYGDVCQAEVCEQYKLQDAKDPKYLAFQRNIELAHMRNERQADSHKTKTVVHGITSLSDLTRPEQWGMLGYKSAPVEEMEKKSLNYEFECDESTGCVENGKKDWRDDGYVTPVKDQGQCGSCWAFSTVESMESAALAQGLYSSDSPYIGSPQEVVSCDHNGDEGCNGGLPENAFKWLKSFPLEEESKYPYKSGDTKVSGHCMKKHKGPGKLNVDTISTVGIMGVGETSDMKKYILNNGPMSVAVAANDDWFTYTGGVMDIDTCPAGQVDHAVQAVALDTDKAEWTIRNSWNTNWGEDGFIRITYGKGTCNIAYDSNVVTVKKADSEFLDLPNQEKSMNI